MSLSRTCRHCGESKPLGEFYRHPYGKDGFDSKCKKCKKSYQRRWHHLNPDKAREINRRKIDRKPELYARLRKRWVSENGDKRRATVKKWIAKNRVKRKAHVAVSNALKSGKILRGVCPCGRTDTHAHHDDYSRPLDVQWLCPSCHGKLHRELKDAARTGSIDT